MIYRIHRDEDSPQIYLDGAINFDIDYHSPEVGNRSFLGTAAIHSYADIWTTPKLKFIVDRLDNFTDRFPDLDAVGSKLFMSEKAYALFKDTFKDHGEFLPVTFNAGTGYIFNPLTTYPALEGSLVTEMGESTPSEFKFDEALITAPIFRCDDLKISRDIFISKDVYRTMRLNGLTGVWFYKDYGAMYSEPEGGFKGSTSMPGYEDED